jgi:hypothetical protein
LLPGIWSVNQARIYSPFCDILSQLAAVSYLGQAAVSVKVEETLLLLQRLGAVSKMTPAKRQVSPQAVKKRGFQVRLRICG